MQVGHRQFDSDAPSVSHVKDTRRHRTVPAAEVEHPGIRSQLEGLGEPVEVVVAHPVDRGQVDLSGVAAIRHDLDSDLQTRRFRRSGQCRWQPHSADGADLRRSLLDPPRKLRLPATTTAGADQADPVSATA
jgi:hypothetical protein